MNEEKTTEKVACLECGKRMTYINNKHLMSHKMTAEEYHKKYPDALMKSALVTAKLKERSVKSNASRKGKPRSEEERAKIAAANKRNGLKRIGIKTGPMKQEQKDLLSAIQKKKYADGISVAYNLGKKISEETKKKISISLTGKVRKKESIAKQIATRKANGIPSSMKGKKHSQATKDLIAQKSSSWQHAKRPFLRSVMLPKIESANLNLLNTIDADIFELECCICGHIFTRTPQMFQPSKYHPEVCDQCFPLSKRSNAEIEIENLIRNFLPEEERIISGDMELISPLEIDIHVPSRKIAVEYCGLYWHSELYGKHRYYHRKKLETVNQKGIKLITIFEDEWINKRSIVENMLKNAFGVISTKIDARKCKIEEVSSEDANNFLKENHIQGRGRSVVRYGLYFENELVSLMTFSNSEISRKLTGWEINRFCSKLGINVRGAAAKLFSKFVKDHNPDIVTSYADLRWGTGNVYGFLGFEKIRNTVPNYWYIKANDIKRYHRYGLRKTDQDDPKQTEWEIRKSEGWNRIWDCGHAKWLWLNPVNQP